MFTSFFSKQGSEEQDDSAGSTEEMKSEVESPTKVGSPQRRRTRFGAVLDLRGISMEQLQQHREHLQILKNRSLRLQQEAADHTQPSALSVLSGFEQEKGVFNATQLNTTGTFFSTES